MKEHSSDAAAFYCDVKEQIRGWYRKWGKNCSSKIKRHTFTSEFTDTFLESSSDEDKDNVI